MPKKTATWPEAGAGYLAADPEMYSLIHAVTTHEIVLPCLAATGFASPPGQNTLSRSNLNQGDHFRKSVQEVGVRHCVA